jgi:DNA repair photolyase
MFVRWQTLLEDPEDQLALPGYREPAVVRRFEAPEALDIRFYEVHAKSVLNRVPESSRMPFRWTVNPYRGCTHACTYCLWGGTPVLMADGHHRPLAELEVGDEIYGTVGDGLNRRYAPTTVLDKWETVKPAYRVTLADGTELIASGDHRFLTRRGWEHVTVSEHGPTQRPHLMLGSRLMGTGAPELLARNSGDPVIDRTRSIAGQMVKTSAELEVSSIEPLDEAMELYDITTGSGDFIANGVVSHNCFARPTHTYLDFNAGRDFEREIVVKVNAPEVLRRELSRPRWTREHVALGTNTDPYQWVEARYRLMPGIWTALRDSGTHCSVLTKSPLILRDLELLRELAADGMLTAALSVPTLDERAWRATEPHTPHPRARLEAVAELNRAGVPTSVMVAPLMPGINDDPAQVARILELAREAGARHVTPVALHLRPGVREVFMDWLAAQRPDLLERYSELYGHGAYAPADERRRLTRLVRGEARTPAAGRRFRRRPDEAERPPPRGPRTAAQPQGRLFDA